MPWAITEGTAIRRDLPANGGVQVVAARAVFTRPAAEATAADPRTEVVLVFRRNVYPPGVNNVGGAPSETPAQFKARLVGAGGAANPDASSEVGSYLAMLNAAAAADVEVPL